MRAHLPLQSCLRESCLLACLLLLVGCSQLPETHYYVLQIATERPAAGPLEGDGWTVGVEPFRVDSPYDGDSIVYRIFEDSPELHFYAFHRWAAPLSRMLPAVVADGLSSAPGVKWVEPTNRRRSYDAHLYGRLLEIAEIDRRDDQMVRIRLELQLVSADGVEIWSQHLEAENVTRTDEVTVIVEQFNRTLGDLLARVRADFGRALSALGGSAG